MVAERCERCLYQRRVCLCAEIPVVQTATRVVIVRHHSERFRSSNSGRLAHLALPNSVIVDYGGGRDQPPPELPSFDGAWLVFPEVDPIAADVPPPRQIVVLDATWSQARRMYRKVDALRGLPTLRLVIGNIPARRLRASPAADRVSTIEAIACAIRMLEGEPGAAELETLFAIAVERAAASGRSLRDASRP